MKACYCGSFDPPTVAHVEIIRTLKEKMGIPEIVIGVGNNPSKTNNFLELYERVWLLSEAVGADIVVEAYDTLTIDFARKHSADFLVRGVRDAADCENELKFSHTISALAGITTVLIPLPSQYGFVSSSLARELYKFSGLSAEFKQLVPGNVYEYLWKKNEG